MIMHYIGIDPGQSGAIAVIDGNNLQILTTDVLKEKTIHEISDVFEYLSQFKPECFAILEQVHSMPKQGVSSSFKFGQSFGQLEGFLAGHKIPFDYASPQKWQKYLGCLSKGDKNVTKALAQRLYPDCKVTHAIADSILIARYAALLKAGQ